MGEKGVVFECFGPKVEKVKEEEVASLLRQNLLVNFFVPFCRAGLALIFLTRRNENEQGGFSFNELFEQLKGRIYPDVSPELLHKYLERSLDILLDIGLFSARWEQKDNYWERLFFNRNEVAQRLRDYNYYIKDIGILLEPIKVQQFFELLLYGPDKDPHFFLKVLDINSYLAHTGDIIDPDHWHINLRCEPSIPYSALWSILERISQNKIYDANIKFHHERKKITIYDLTSWIETKKNVEITQCKMRFLLNPDEVPKDADFKIKQLLIVPIVNIKLNTEKGEEDYSTVIDDTTSKLVKELTLSFLEKFKQELGDASFSINAKCNLMEIKDKGGYQTKKKEFKKELFQYGTWDEKLDVGLKHLNCWESFVPEVIREKADEIENDLKECIISRCNHLDKENMLLLTLARKGDVLVKHLYEVFKEDKDFKETLKKFNKNYKNDEFHNISETEFFEKAKKGEYNGGLNLVIFDDTVDKGRKLGSVLKKINKIEREGNLKIESRKAMAFIGNKKNFETLEKELKRQGVEISACNKV